MVGGDERIAGNCPVLSICYALYLQKKDTRIGTGPRDRVVTNLGFAPSSIEIIERADHTVSALLEHVGVDHGCRYIPVPEQLLNSLDIDFAREEVVGGKRMTENVAADSLADPVEPSKDLRLPPHWSIRRAPDLLPGTNRGDFAVQGNLEHPFIESNTKAFMALGSGSPERRCRQRPDG
jgi:hypothetical protein